MEVEEMEGRGGMLDYTVGGSGWLRQPGLNNKTMGYPDSRAKAQCWVWCVGLQVVGSVATFNSHRLVGGAQHVVEK